MNDKSKAWKAPPPIVFIVLGLVIFGGINWFEQSDWIGNVSPATNEPHSSQKRFSLGEELLIKADATNPKQEGIKAFADRDYRGAIDLFQISLQQFPNDPETLIYLNNAKVATLNPAKIAVVVPIGSNLNVAQEILRGVAQAQSEFNSSGGKLQVEIVNDENKPEIATQVANEIGRDKSILAVVGHNSSNASLAAASIYQQQGLVMITPTSTSDRLSNAGSYIFRTVPSNKEMTKTLAEYTVKTARRKKVAICYDSGSQDSLSFKEGFTASLAAAGGRLIPTECDLSSSQFDADRQLGDLISEGAEAVLMSPHVDRLDLAIALAKANQWRLVLLGTLTFDTPEITESGQGDINGIVIPLPFHHDLTSARSFGTAASQQWGIDVNWRTATAYDATRAILAGLSEGSTRSELQKALSSQDFSISGANGKVEFEKTGDRSLEPVLAEVKPSARGGYYFELLSNK